MRQFRDSSIKNKLTAIILLTSGILLLLTSSALVTREWFVFRQTMVDDLFVFADLVGINSAAGLSFDHNPSVEENIAALKANKRIILTHVFKKGKIIASYFRDQDVQAEYNISSLRSLNDYYFSNSEVQNDKQIEDKQIEDKYFFHDNYVDIFKKIIFDNEIIGTVYIRSDLVALHNHLWRAGSIVVVVLLFALLLGIFIANQLQQLITTPIYHLLKTMGMVSAQKDYSLRAQKQGDDEIGGLIDGFNEMLAKIEQYRNHLEDKVKQRTAQLADARDQALAANKAKSVFLANMSHEIRTPMNAVLGYTQILLRNGNLIQEQQDSLHAIEKGGTHLLSLINDILDISKIEAGAMELHSEKFYLNELIDGLSVMFKMRCEQKHLSWRVENTISGQRLLYADQNKLHQIFINLLGNAIKFTERGEIALRVTQLDADSYRFDVIDTGVGISLDSQKTIFKPFQQEEAGYDKGGTGLGLAICQQQVDLMGGALTLESELGEGACFTVIVPLPAGNGEVAVKEETHAEITHIAPGYHVSALVVDDMKANRDILARMLQAVGVEVREVVNGQDCLDKIHELLPDIVFMDMRMPIMTGMTAIHYIREEFSDNIRCIAITASMLKQDSDHQELQEAGFDDFIAKPFRFDMVYNCLKKCLPVEFEYKNINGVEEPEKMTLDLDKFSLPHALYERLIEAAELSNLTALESIVAELQKGNQEQQVFAEICQEFIANYDIDSLIEILEKMSANDYVKK
jgi:signal transduction histidine kinase/CheY-like chemotaxis protein